MSTATSSVPAQFVGEGFSEELTCAVCLDAWNEPTEALPCGHIFCKSCMRSMKLCAVCRKNISSTKSPNRALINMAMQVKVRCLQCGWKGSREQSTNHLCNTAIPCTSSSPPAYSPPADAVSWHGAGNTAGARQGVAGSRVGAQPSVPRRAPRYEVIEPIGAQPWRLYDLTQEEYDNIVSIFVFFDDDDSGELDRNEVTRLARWLNFARTSQEVDDIFNSMDVDGSGRLSQGEFLSWLCHNKPNPQSLYGLTQQQYNTLMIQFHTYDSNQDGLLEKGEFMRLVLNLRDVSSAGEAGRLFEMIDQDRDNVINLHDFLVFRAGKAVVAR